MNRAINIQQENTLKHFEEITEYENEHELKPIIEYGLSSIFLISQKFPIKNVTDFISGENFSITESFEELESSYHIAKYGFFKQSMISLRVAFDIGLLSIYWSIIGSDNEKFKKWYSSKAKSPYKNKAFWKVLNSDNDIASYGERFNLKKEINDLGTLSNYVHTNGIHYTNLGPIASNLKENNKFENFNLWIEKLKKIVRVLEILHLLRYPKMCIDFSSEFLLSKFGTFNKIPQFGGGLGDEKKYVTSFLKEEELDYIEHLSNQHEEVRNIKEWVYDLPELSGEEIRKLIYEEQKNNILNSGFKNWNEFSYAYDHRIDKQMVQKLKEWATEKGCMTLDDVKNHKFEDL